MIHAIVFANREKGNQLYERTPGFPADAASEILTLCNRMRASDSIHETKPVLRYQPLGERYLLSVVQRNRQGSGAEIRSHVVSVNFLMESQDADCFFRTPFPIAAKVAEEVAQKLLNGTQDIIPRELCDLLLQPPIQEQEPVCFDTPLPVLMTGAAYSLEQQLTSQLFIQSTSPAVDELSGLFSVLPPPLRKKISFHTGCVEAGECYGLGICYCSGQTLRDMLALGFPGGPLTTKFWYRSEREQLANKMDDQYRNMVIRLIQIPAKIPLYHLLRDAITDWTVYRELSLLVTGEPSLKEVLRLLPEKEVIRIIDSGSATDEQLADLKKATQSGSPIGKAVRSRCRKRESHSKERKQSKDHRHRKQKWYWLPVCCCTLAVVLNFSAVLNGIGNDPIRELVLVAAVFCFGFFLNAALRSSK